MDLIITILPTVVTKLRISSSLPGSGLRFFVTRQVKSRKPLLLANQYYYG